MTPSLKKASGTTNGIHGNGNVKETSEKSKSSHPIDTSWQFVTIKKLLLINVLVALFISYYIGFTILFPLTFLLTFIPVFCTYLGVQNCFYVFNSPAGLSSFLPWFKTPGGSKIDKYVEFLDERVKEKFSGRFIPIRDLYELYADGKIEFKLSVLDTLEMRNEFASFKLQWWHLKFFITRFLPELLHNKNQDDEQVRDHYDRGNDFYEAFLGPMMIYTSGIRKSKHDTLEDMQENKLKTVCEKILLKENESHLDIGCGWGTLVNYAAEKYGTDSTGVTLAQEQVNWANNVVKEKSLEKRSTFKRMDYRDIEEKKYDKITCLEMAEHVGIRYFPNFLDQVHQLLEDDGIFFLQIAGLRRAWQWEDMLWGFFMDTYVFPGADASLPLAFPISQLENAGFEIQSVETVGVHYSDTIRYWYENWSRPDVKEMISNKYGIRIYRIWEIFLAWSVIVARQGSSTCFQIVAHKNRNHFSRRSFMAHNRSE